MGACAMLLLAEQFPASPMPRELVHPEAPLATLDIAGLSMVLWCPLLALLSALELLNCIGAHFWTMMFLHLC